MTRLELQREPGRAGEAGSALILALMVALVLAFLGMGLLLQTSLGLQASGADRWVTKSMHAAEAGVMMQIEMIQLEQLAAPTGGFALREDMGVDSGSSSPGRLAGQYQITLSPLCELEPATPVLLWPWPDFGRRYFHIRSQASRNVGHLVGLTQAAIEADVSVWPFQMSGYTPVTMCN